MQKHLPTRLLSLLLAVVLLLGIAPTAYAVDTDSSITVTQVDNSAVSVNPFQREAFEEAEGPALYADTEDVRVSIVLSGKSTIEHMGTTENIAVNTQAVSYRANLEKVQDLRTTAISQAIGEPLDVVWNLTLAANIISANVKYGQIEAIEQVSGVEAVLIETRYEPDVVNREEISDPNMATSGKQIGTAAAWAAGYTGAGSRIAVIDTGLDIKHQSFNDQAFQYSLSKWASEYGRTVESLNLLDEKEVSSVADQLNAAARVKGFSAVETYVSSKIPFGFNYVDKDYDVEHLNDYAGEHGSHVAGIATANAYLAQDNGVFVSALDKAKVQGVAPDAQLMVMKVFGKGGGAYSSDYMAAIEDAIVLGADSINLSLGSGAPGTSRSSDATYQGILDSLTETGTVVCMSAGNSGNWVENAYNAGFLYADDVSMQTDGAPGSYTNSLTVASVENDGAIVSHFKVGSELIPYNENLYYNVPLANLPDLLGSQKVEYEYVFIDGLGTQDEWYRLGGKKLLEGKVAICSRGDITFAEKVNAAVNYGAVATVIYNNEPGALLMMLDGYYKSYPAVSISQAAGALVKGLSTPVTDDEGKVLYYTGTMTIVKDVRAEQNNSDYYTMSSFSSWGVPGSLELKPEITAPGGGIYSVNGKHLTRDNGLFLGGPDAYETMSGTSMASPQVAGMAALAAQYIRQNNLTEKTGLTARQLAMSLLMSTAEPIVDGDTGCYYPLLQQGAGLANIGSVTNADSYILMGENATKTWDDGKVKVELGDDPNYDGKYTFSFSIHNLDSKEKAYNLSADFFTQDLFMDFANSKESDDELAYYMDTWCKAMPVNVTWSVGGKALTSGGALSASMDFNGDGCVNTADGQALLDYATGARAELSNSVAADLDKDGDADSHDAYLFFKALNEGTLVVPANGSADVTVTVELTDAWDELLTIAENGVYVEGYVFVEGLTDAEGVLGTRHSIPVLGFYGNWSDPSMYDVGSYVEYASGDEYRIPYLGLTNSNAWLITYGNEPKAYYAFGGNPLVPDETYLPERNAINSESGDSISKVHICPIRNAANAKFTAVNKTTDEPLAEVKLGEIPSAYYHANSGRWLNYSYYGSTKFLPNGASEGDALELTLTLAPEYYVDEKGNTNWEALGRGADFSVSMVVDNTAPELGEVNVDLGNNVLTVTASDNQYVAAVGLFNKTGTRLFDITGAKMDIQPGETAQYVLDLSEVNGENFLLQVFDYAMNTVTYKIEMTIGELPEAPDMFAFDIETHSSEHPELYRKWLPIDRNTFLSDPVPTLADSDVTILAGCVVKGMVYASDEDGNLYAMDQRDLYTRNFIRNTGHVFTDMAYNPVDEILYGIENMVLYSINLYDGETVEIGKVNMATNTLACDDKGNFYSVVYGYGDTAGYLYTYTLDTVKSGDAPTQLTQYKASGSYDGNKIENTYVQSLAWNPNDKHVYWASYDYYYFMAAFVFGRLFDFDPTTGNHKLCYNQNYMRELTALCIPDKDDKDISWTEDTNVPTSVWVSRESVTLLPGNEIGLTAAAMPWMLENRDVIWSSADPSVATVGPNGVVTAVAPGETTIRATSVLGSSVYAECTVTVEALDVTLKGVLQDVDSNAFFFDWNTRTDDSWTRGNPLDTNISSATLDTDNNKLYVMDSNPDVWAMHRVDPDTGVIEESFENTAALPLWDMAYSEYFSKKNTPKVFSVCESALIAPYAVDALGAELYFNLYPYLESVGAGYLVAVASAGYEQYHDAKTDKYYDAERVIALDNTGNLWTLWVYVKDKYFPSEPDEYTAIIRHDASNLDLEFPGAGDNIYSSMVLGEDGALYLSAFTGETNELYRLTFNEALKEYEANRIGDVGRDVWPAALYAVETNSAESVNILPALDMDTPEQIDAEPLTEEALEAIREGAKVLAANSSMDRVANGSLNSVAAYSAASEHPVLPMSDTKTEDSTLIVTITAKNAEGEDVLTHNGVDVVRYDPEALTLTGVTIHSDYQSVIREDEAGKVTFGYISLDGIQAGEAVATLSFAVKGDTAGSVTIEHKETNGEHSDYDEVLTPTLDCVHANTDVLDAKEATCTEDGYTGDTYCTGCGETIKTGEAIPALGHDFSVKVETVDPTETEDGYTVCKCNRCDAIERRDFVPAQKEWPYIPPVVPGKPNKPETPADPQAPASELPFTDVDVNDSFYESVKYVYEKGLMIGTSDTTFAPNATFTRAQVSMILFRFQNCPTTGFQAIFNDVLDGAWYAEAIIWASGQGIVKGYGNGKFGPENAVTVEQLLTLLYRYAKSKGCDVTALGEVSGYTDSASISDYALNAVRWAVAKGLVSGQGNLNPRQPATRAQVAQILMAFCENAGE